MRWVVPVVAQRCTPYAPIRCPSVRWQCHAQGPVGRVAGVSWCWRAVAWHPLTPSPDMAQLLHCLSDRTAPRRLFRHSPIDTSSTMVT
jgi:hypothetical protein